MLTIADATANDVEVILGFIQELAQYERLAHACVATSMELRRTLFGQHRFAGAVIARLDDEPVGYALFFFNYSTFLAKPGIYLEDLYVQPKHRGNGVGKALLKNVAAQAIKVGAGRLEWSVLDWNEPAIGFYKSLGAEALDDWTVFRLSGDALKEFGAEGAAKLDIRVLRSDRLTLRPGLVSDAPRITELLQDPDIGLNLGGLPQPYTLADAEAYLGSVGTKPDKYDWVLELPDAGVVGTIHCAVSSRHRSGYLGFWLGKPYWGNGYMPEAIRRVIKFAFEELDLERVEAERFTRNAASGRAMEKAGMRLEGVRKSAFNKGGEQLDLAFYGLSRQDAGMT
ncbi:MAG TPA: GNAT family N-acetyltransferase [Fimbriimonadaceae bacterium]|nr:GNAT family N-acetyltransferase [Fimbriimonadaceae bacterium]